MEKDLKDEKIKYKHQFDVWCRTYNISREKLELFHDFLISLSMIIDKTYLGDDFIKTDEDKNKHFKWCWEKNIENFKKEKISFSNSLLFFNFFYFFYIKSYYEALKDDLTLKLVIDYFNVLFDPNKEKTRAELATMTDIYKILDENLKKPF